MTLTKSGGYRFPPCVVCKDEQEHGLRRYVRAGRCRIRGVGDVCSQHFQQWRRFNGE